MKTEEELAKEYDMTVEDYRNINRVKVWLVGLLDSVGIKKRKK